MGRPRQVCVPTFAGWRTWLAIRMKTSSWKSVDGWEPSGRENEQNGVTHQVPIKNCLRLPWVESKTMFRWSNSTCLLIFWLISIFVNLHFVAYMFPFLSRRSPCTASIVGIQENTCHCSPEFCWFTNLRKHWELSRSTAMIATRSLRNLASLKLGCKWCKCNRVKTCQNQIKGNLETL